VVDLEDNVRFIRKNGRVIPISESKNIKKGAAEVAGGAGIGAATALTSGSLISRAGSIRERGEKIADYSSYKTAGRKMLHNNLLNKKASAIAKNAFRVRNIGVGVASVLVGAGVNRILGETKLRDSQKRAEISGASGAAAGFLVHHSTRQIANSAGFKRGMGNILRAAIKAAKTKL
jgi:hypothetical protein